MSDYERNKAVRVPLGTYHLMRFNVTTMEELEEYFDENFPELFNRANKKYFTVSWTDKDCYLDWEFYSSYGEESGDYAFSRFLTEMEYQTIKEKFEEVLGEFYPDDARLVDYCYYNGSDPDDCYEIKSEDYSNEF